MNTDIEDVDIHVKVSLIGDTSVGKTTLIKRLILD